MDEMDECCHLLPPGQCAYCSGSWRREQDELAAETRRIVTAMAKKRARSGTGVTKRAGWTVGNG